MLREIVAGYKLLMCPRYRTATPPLPFSACSLAVADLACSVGFLIYLNLNLFACLSLSPTALFAFIYRPQCVVCVYIVCVLCVCVFVCVVLNVVSAYFWGLLFSGFVFN